MKIKKLALLLSLLSANSATTALVVKKSTPSHTSEVVEAIDKNKDVISDNWMYISIIAIFIVLLVLITVMFWTKRRGKQKD